MTHCTANVFSYNTDNNKKIYLIHRQYDLEELRSWPEVEGIWADETRPNTLKIS
jgi:hypothetical protein